MALPDFLGFHRTDEVATPSLPVSLVFIVAAVLGIGFLAGQWAVLVYALSFWHYPIYALAFVLRKVPLAVFERDAVLMKAVSLVAFGAVYLTMPPDLLSLLVVGIGLLFNLSAARALGTDRTYYGYELAALPPKLITSFPYSVLSHPMLTGNAVAFTGTLLNDAFRAEWWPLAVAHVVLNLAMLVMEARARPRRLERPALLDRQPWLTAWPTGAGVVAAGALVAGLAGGGVAFALGIALAVLAYGCVLLAAYAWPAASADGRKGREERGG
jgi:protein-S-isoprenylcysteine O-methyltransferase Ste14